MDASWFATVRVATPHARAIASWGAPPMSSVTTRRSALERHGGKCQLGAGYVTTRYDPSDRRKRTARAPSGGWVDDRGSVDLGSRPPPSKKATSSASERSP